MTRSQVCLVGSWDCFLSEVVLCPGLLNVLNVWQQPSWCSSHRNTVSGIKRDCWLSRSFCLVPPQAGDWSSAWMGWGAAEAALVSLPSCCFSYSLCWSVQAACPDYLSVQFVFEHTCCLRGLLVGRFSLWCAIRFCFQHLLNVPEQLHLDIFWFISTDASWNGIWFYSVVYESRQLHPCWTYSVAFL